MEARARLSADVATAHRARAASSAVAAASLAVAAAALLVPGLVWMLLRLALAALIVLGAAGVGALHGFGWERALSAAARMAGALACSAPGLAVRAWASHRADEARG